MSKLEGNKKLEVRGSGYSAPQPPPRHSKRGPFVMPSLKAAQQRTASAPRIAMVPGQSSQQRHSTSLIHTRFGSASNIASQQVCNCQHPADVAFLQDVYSEKMRVQQEISELRNYILNMPSGQVTTESQEITHKPAQIGHSNVNQARQPRKVLFTHESVESKVSSDQILFNQLEEAYQKENKLQDRIKALIHDNRKLTIARDEALERLAGFEGGSKSFTAERRSLMEDNVELQRRLDNLTPLLAEKSAEIARFELEKTILLKRLRTSTTNRQTSMSDKPFDYDIDSKHSHLNEIKRLNDKNQTAQIELNDFKLRETELMDQLSAFRQKLKEQQQMIKTDNAVKSNLTEESNKLIRENTKLTANITKLENIIEKQQAQIHSKPTVDITPEELKTLRDLFNKTKGDLAASKERLKILEEHKAKLEHQIREQELQEEHEHASRTKLQEELAALKVLSNSLSAENQGLREEKITLTERIETLYEKLSHSEQEIMWLAKKLEEFKRHYFETIERLQMELKRQTEASTELEEIVQKAHELSTSFPKWARKRTETKYETVTTVVKQLPSVSELASISGSSASSSRSSSRSAHSIKSEDKRVLTSPPKTVNFSQRPALSPVHGSPTSSFRDSEGRLRHSSSLISGSRETNRSLATFKSASEEATTSTLAQKYRRKNS